ncbi:MAG: translocation/assembly module TamB domain-containing protein, partial [Hyphomonadaceae bacterium]|nr:translocation/assembly module TamB domain-containing protein [Hyphomonadaceae bacterium]
SAEGEGDTQTGSARYGARLGGAQLLAGVAEWTPATWSLDASAELEALPLTREIARRIGPRVALQAEGERVGAFAIRAETPALAAAISGRVDQQRRLRGGARFIVTSPHVSEVAFESPFDLGAGRFEGELRRARGVTAIRGDLTVRDVSALGSRASFSGPVQASLSEDAFALNGDLRAAEGDALFANARLRTDLSFDRTRGRFALTSATLEGDALALDARGWTGRGDGQFSGAWRVRNLAVLSADLRGAASGQWRAFSGTQGAARIWTLAVQGAGENIAGAPEIAPQLLGRAPALDAQLRVENGGVTVSHARLQGQNLRAAATGRIVGGQSDLSLEASARGPLNVGGAEIAGAIDATGRLTGDIARPTLSAQAAMSSFAAGGVTVEQPRLSFTLAPAGQAYVGRASLEGAVNGQPASGESRVALSEGGVDLTELTAQLGAMHARGEAHVTARGLSAQLAVDGVLDGLIGGVTGRLSGDLSLTPEQLQLDAQIANGRAGDLYARTATLRASGPLHALAATFDMHGRLNQAPLTFAGTASVNTRESRAHIDGRGELAGASLFTRAPIAVDWSGGSFDASVNVAIDDGVVMAQWRDRRRALSGSAQIEDAPLAPLAAIWGERATGRIDGAVTLANQGGGLAGEANLAFQAARFAGRQRGTLDMQLNAALTTTRLTATVDARSSDGMVARLQADAPVVTDATPVRIALAPERRGRATWTVRGPAATLWAAARLPDQSLDGALDGEGELQFGAGHLSGAGHIEIANGRFEDKLTGIVLSALDARVDFGADGVQIARFTATAPGGGRLTASGGSANPREGRIQVSLDNVRVADRPEARARASGNLTLAWEGLRSSFTGELNIIEANIDIATNAEAGIATIDVIEINRPGIEDETAEQAERAEDRRNNATTLDVRVRAPGRVFTRGRGVDAEWALNMRLGGTAHAPQVFGSATAVRGALSLSGQPFDIQEARIDFNGDPLDARINLVARRDTADLTAYMRLTGTARAPEISFTSDPALPEDEILPQVLFGRSVQDLSAFEAAQLASSLAALSGRASIDLVDAARAATGLDRFAVRQDEDGGFLVAGGVYLTRDVYLEVARTGLGQAQTRVEWTVRPRLVLITSFLGNGDQRVSLRWRRETD